MTTTIAEHVASCLESFRLIAAVSIATAQDQNDSTKPGWKIRDELSRFKVWIGNMDAHQRGESSLEYRLRDASHLSTQVKALLEDLKCALDDAFSILNGSKTPWDQELTDDESDDESTSGPDDDSIGFCTEMDQLAVDVAEVINCLLKLSVSIRNPAPHDRFRGSTKTDTSFYEPTDIAHVQATYDKADINLVALLGKANTRRRQYFRYLKSNSQKLSLGLNVDHHAGKTISEQQTTVISSIADAPKASASATTNVMDVDELSDSGFTQTSFASFSNTSDQARLPALPLEATKGPFQCPFCFMMITVTTSYTWREHIFADLRPYVCLCMDCPIAGAEFGRRHEWMQHMLQNHWLDWRCLFCVHEPFTSASRLRNHLQYLHAQLVPEEGIETAINICEHPSSFDANTKCPLCDCSLGDARAYRHHVGRHLEDIALFVLPNNPGEDGLLDDDDSINSSIEMEPDGIDTYDIELEEAASILAGEMMTIQVDSTSSDKDIRVKEAGDDVKEEIQTSEYRRRMRQYLSDDAAKDTKTAQEATKKEDEVWKKKMLAEFQATAEESSSKQKGKDEAPIRFKDAVGRKFSFPFHLCQTWTGMEELIKQAFLHVDVIGPHVQAGHYDLLGPDQEIILPQVWEKVIEPNWAITMVMWPMDRHRRPGHPGAFHPDVPGRPVGAMVHLPVSYHGLDAPWDVLMRIKMRSAERHIHTNLLLLRDFLILGNSMEQEERRRLCLEGKRKSKATGTELFLASMGGDSGKAASGQVHKPLAEDADAELPRSDMA
ncbi:hypothetical protein G7054_g2051 [Neopestalotiopsis clavispora]|nr:hypothetical protein G7054_g2051 [Neopestalotiopsis clavispora]